MGKPAKKNKKRKVYGDYEQMALLRTIHKDVNEMKKEIKKMAKTLAETQVEMASLKSAITEQVQEVTDLIAAVEKLIEAGPGTSPEDLQPLFDEIVAAKDALVGDNEAVKAALAKVTPPVA